MTRYFAGNSMAAFQRSSATPVEVTTAGRFNATYVANAINVIGDNSFITSPTFAAAGMVYLRWTEYQAASGAAVNAGPSLYNGATGIFRIVTLAAYSQQCQYWNGAAWVNTGAAFALSASALNVFVLTVNLVAGSFTLTRNNIAVTNGSGWVGYTATATNARFYSKVAGASFGTFYSEIMCADYDISLSHFMVPAINGNSAVNTGAASGTYTDVNETPTNDANGIVVAVAGNKAGLTKAAIALPANYAIAAAVVSGRGDIAGAIINGKLGVRSAGGINQSSAGLGYAATLGPATYILALDPDTGTPFSQASFNAAEIYLEAA